MARRRSCGYEPTEARSIRLGYLQRAAAIRQVPINIHGPLWYVGTHSAAKSSTKAVLDGWQH